MKNRPCALVTGGSRGIGRGVCIGLAQAGYNLVVNFATRRESAEETVEALVAKGAEAIAVGGNVADRDAQSRLIDSTYDRFGRLDMLVNNAGITSQGRNDILEATEASWDTVFDTNLKGPFFLTQSVARRMIDQIEDGIIPNAKIVIISSISSFAVSTNRADYCMTKAALGMMTKLFAQRLANERINVYEISPGVIESDMTSGVREKYDRLIEEGCWPIKRWGTPEDVGRAVAALAGDYFPFTTGSRFDVDGGFHIRSL
jgi:3-oxoacyl-[acyl-carrier protein] reductase